MIRPVLFITVLAGALSLASCGGKGKPAAGGGAPVTARAEVGPLSVTVSAYGDIAPRQSTRLVPRIRDTVTITEIVGNGVRVEAGDVIARFNDEAVKAKILELEQQIADLEVTLADNEAQVVVQKLDNTTSLKVAEDAVKAAEMEQQKFAQAVRAQEKRTAELKVQTARSDLDRAEKRHTDLQGLLKQGFITEDEVEEGRINLEKARVASETAIMDLKVLLDYTHPLSETTLANKLEQARTTLEKTRASNNTQLLTKQRALETSQRSLASKRELLTREKEELAAYVVTAPTGGIVLYREGDRRSSESEPLAVGQTLRAGQVLATLPDMSAMKVRLKVPESDITRVKVGQDVRIRIDALPDRTLLGKVEKVADAALDEGWFSSGIKEFEVEVSLDQAHQANLKPGYSCQADIICATAEKALQVPVAAVYELDGATVVYPAEGGGKAKPVKLGLLSVTHAEVTSGLSEGERVLLARPKRDNPAGS